jgi:hypothetical protein
MFDHKRILNYDESYLHVNNKDPNYPSRTLFLVDETFFKEYFFPIDKRIIDVYFCRFNSLSSNIEILNIDIQDQKIINELVLKGYEII